MFSGPSIGFYRIGDVGDLLWEVLLTIDLRNQVPCGIRRLEAAEQRCLFIGESDATVRWHFQGLVGDGTHRGWVRFA